MSAAGERVREALYCTSRWRKVGAGDEALAALARLEAVAEAARPFAVFARELSIGSINNVRELRVSAEEFDALVAALRDLDDLGSSKDPSKQGLDVALGEEQS